jgi:hypothetical protein
MADMVGEKAQVIHASSVLEPAMLVRDSSSRAIQVG